MDSISQEDQQNLTAEQIYGYVFLAITNCTYDWESIQVQDKGAMVRGSHCQLTMRSVAPS